MKRFTVSIIVGGFLTVYMGIFVSPSLVLALNDVTLTTSTILSVGGYTLNVTGSSAVIDTITVNATNFSVTLSSGSSIQITSPTYQQLSVDTSTFTTSNNCANNTSILTLSSSGTSGTVTITPSATICTTAPASSSGSSSGGSGYSPRIVTIASTSPVIVPGCPSNTICTPNPLTNNQAKTNNQFTRDLAVGSIGLDVKKLQIFLNTHGYLITTVGPGSLGQESENFGNLTKNALIKFQRTNNIASTGYFGPLTRTLVNSLNVANLGETTSNKQPLNINSQLATSPQQSGTNTQFTRNLGFGSVGSDVTKLQTILHSAGFLKVSPTGYYGPLTESAVKLYQSVRNITPTGFVGPITRRELGY